MPIRSTFLSIHPTLSTILLLSLSFAAAAAAAASSSSPDNDLPPQGQFPLPRLHDPSLDYVTSLSTAASHQQPPGGSAALHNILANTHRSGLYNYPTDFTRGIVPKPIHSHNDYWRDVPFYSALAWGASSVEADVWLVDGELYVGHEESALTHTRTLDALYIQPILDTLRRQNPNTPFVKGSTKHGVFDTDPGATLTLLIDLKTDPASTWPAVLAALAPLRELKYLTTYDADTATTTRGAVTVIGTGLTPLAPIAAQNPRWAFYDAPLQHLSSSSSSSSIGTDLTNITSPIAPLASAPLQSQFGLLNSSTGMSPSVVEQVTAQVKAAHARGIKARYWDLPEWPRAVREVVWRQLLDAGVDVLNVDDLAGAVGWWEGRGL